MNFRREGILVVACAALCLGWALPAAGGAYSDLIMADNPMGYWRLDESSGPTAEDFTSNNIDLTYGGAVSYGEAGILGAEGNGAVGLDGSTAYVRDTAWGRFVKNQITLDIWFKPNVASGTQILMGSTGALNSYAYRYYMYGTGSRVAFRMYDGNYRILTSDDSFILDEWNHVALTYEVGDKIKMWLNGEKQSSEVDLTSASPWGYMQFGTTLWKDGIPKNSFNGLIDEAVIYDTALDGATIRQHYWEGSGLPEPSTVTLLLLGLLALTFRRGRRL